MSKSKNKVIRFFRTNASYLVLALCIVAVGVAATLAIVLGASQPFNETNTDVVAPAPDDTDNSDEPENEPTPDTPDSPVIEVITFAMPVNAPTSIQHYSEQMVFNSTLNRYTAHMAIDFFAEEGAPVYAVWDGTVESVTNDILKGVTVIIDHGNGLKTVYNSLADVDAVSQGQTVKKGDVIGEVSVTNRQESKNGAHLHFEVYEAGEIIDPAKYLTIDEK